MIFAPRKNIYFPKYQRGNFSMFPAGSTSITDAGPAVSANTSNHSKTRFSAGTAYAIIEFDPDGSEDANNTASSTSLTEAARGTWLDAGTGAEVWIERTITSGSLNHSDAGAGRLQLNVSRQFGVTRTANGTSTTDLTLDFYDASSGGNLLDTVAISLIVTVDGA